MPSLETVLADFSKTHDLMVPANLRDGYEILPDDVVYQAYVIAHSLMVAAGMRAHPHHQMVPLIAIMASPPTTGKSGCGTGARKEFTKKKRGASAPLFFIIVQCQRVETRC